MAGKETKDRERTELYEREMKHEEHRETPLDTAGREAREAERTAEERRREREIEEGRSERAD